MRNQRIATLAAAAALLTAAASVGQPQSYDPATRDQPTATPPAGSSAQPSTTPGSSSSTAGSGASSASAPSSSTTGGAASRLESVDAEFLRKAVEGGRAEVDAAQLAMRDAQRAEIRNAASMMLEDHRRANQQLEQLAKGKGWALPAATPERDQPLTKGGDFDSQYVEQQIRAHRETIAMFRAQSAGGSDPELVRFAQDTLPTLEHHLEMLQSANTAK